MLSNFTICCSSVYVLYVVQCGAHLLIVWLISCRVQLIVWFNYAKVMFNSSRCNFVLSSMWEIKRIFVYKIHEKQIQLLYFQVVKHAWFWLAVWSSSMLYIVQYGAQLMLGSFVVVSSYLFSSILQCNVQLLWVHSVIVYHVRNKSNLAVLNTWETNTIAILPSR